MAASAWGQDLASWFASDPRAAAYTGVRPELEQLVAEARLRGLPVEPLVDKLREGASKGVGADLLLSALGETVQRLGRARQILEQASGGRSDFGDEDLQAFSLLLLRGLPEDTARGLIAHGLQAGRGLAAVRAACDAVAGLLTVAGLGGGEASEVGLRTGTALLDGRLPPSAYGSLAQVYLQGRAAGLGDEEILDDVIIGTLRAGGGIASMNEKIGRIRRTGKPPQPGPPKQPPGQAKDKPERPEKKDK